ncbi:MAG: DNA internalization-related competence protein ComEC/Rec2 [Candidatus Aureabacteria bacterium]|nr:DNA internalization-related competence protein ComEC/Rec2 [Candidatus Auribacterota bacterium]
MRRPAFYLALAFAGGILLCRSLGTAYLVPAAFLSLVFACGGALLPWPHPSTGMTVLAAFLAGFFTCARYERALDHGDLRILFGERSARIGVRGILVAAGQWEEGREGRGSARYRAVGTMGVREVETTRGWIPVCGRVRITLLSGRPIELACGDSLQLVGTLRRIRGATNPGQFDRRAFWHRRGIDYFLAVRGESQIVCIESGRARAIFRWTEWLRERLRRGLERGVPDGPERQIILAMILGYRENIGDEINRPFQLTNTMHILAISGLHVGFFYLMVGALLKLLRVPQRIAALITIPLIAAYAMLTGLAVPVLRASVMFIAFLAAPFLSRQRDATNSLGVAALILLALNPLQLFDAGFQLSFVAVLSILVLARPINSLFLRVWPCGPLPGQLLVGRGERLRWYFGKRVMVLCATSIATWVGMTPLIAYSFHIVTSLGLLGNMVVIPAGLAVVCLGFSGAFCSLISSPLAGLINWLNYCVVRLMFEAIALIARIPCSWRYVPPPGPFQFFSYYGAVAAGGLFIWGGWRKKERYLVLLAAAVLLILPFAFVREHPLLTIVFLDVGQGDASYIKFPGGENLLIDGGPEAGVSAGRVIVRPFLQALGRARVDTVLLTHPHDDHIDGLFTVLQEFSVRRLVLTGTAPSSDNCRKLLGLAHAKGIRVYTVERGDRLARGDGVSITVLNPGRNPHSGAQSDLNNNSVALLTEYGEVKILLCADMEKEAEGELCRSGLPLKADVLRIGHHGGKSSCTDEFLRRVSPKLAILSAGENNKFGHPSPEALARLRQAGCVVLRTDVHGAITLTTDGRKIDIHTFR